jgi:hypothetical protein
MPKMQVTSQIEIDFDEVLEGIARLETSAFEQFVDKVMTLRAQRRASLLPQNEVELLQQATLGLSEHTWQRYHELSEKLQDETLQPGEQQELIGITDKMETANVQRIEALTKLADLRQTTVDALLDELGLRPPLMSEDRLTSDQKQSCC